MMTLFAFFVFLSVCWIIFDREVLAKRRGGDEQQQTGVSGKKNGRDNVVEPAQISGEHPGTAMNALAGIGKKSDGNLTRPIFEEFDHSLPSQDRQDDLTCPVVGGTGAPPTNLFEMDKEGDLSRPWFGGDEGDKKGW